MAKNNNVNEFSLKDEIFNSMAMLIFFGAAFGFLMNIFMALRGEGNMALMVIIGMVIFGCIGAGYAFKLRKFDKEYGIRPDNKYSIDKIKEYFGAPEGIIEDKDNSYYTFREEIMGMFSKTHTFTTDKSGIVIKHEVSSIETNKKK